jgi:hypothetical protein
MPVPPQLNIPVSLNLDQLKKGMQETSALTGTATRAIAKGFIDANASVLATAGTIGTVVGGFRTFLGILGPLAVGITAVKGVFDLMGYATDLAKQKIEEFYQTAERAGKAGVSTDFFQRMTKSGEALKLTVDDINAAIDKFATKSQARLGGSELDKQVKELTDAGNFKGNSGVSAVNNAVGTEAKLRATVDLITEAIAKGERLAALDIADKVFGSKIADNLRANSAYLKEMLDTADKLAASKIVSEEEIGRAVDLKNRFEDAQKVLTERFKPIQDDLAKLGMNYQESWVSIYEYMAKAVGVGNDLYAALKEIPDVLARAGNASFWSKLTEATGKLGLNSDPASLGIEPITSISVGSPASNKLAGLLNNPAAVKKAMQDAIDAETKVLGDKSKAPAPKTQAADRDPFEVALDQGNKRIAIMDAETASIGKSNEARERGKVVAGLEEAAKRANAAAGKELYGVTEATNPKIAEQADKMLAAAKAARQQQLAFEGVQDALRYAGNQTLQILDQIGKRGSTFGSIMAGVFNNLSKQMLMAAITGEGSFAKLFGMAGTNGGVGGIFGAIGKLFTGSSSALPLPGAGDFIGPVLKADGGFISGPGSSRSDSIPARLSNGEFVVNAHSTSQNRALLEAINGGHLRGFADGGLASNVPSLPSTTQIGGTTNHFSPSIAVTVQGSPGQSPQDHARMGAEVAKAAGAHIQAMIGDQLRTQMRPGGVLHRR